MPISKNDMDMKSNWILNHPSTPTYTFVLAPSSNQYRYVII